MKELNKKGFTLVELLAVIVILALLMVVATRTIGGSLNKSKQAAIETEAQKLVSRTYEDIQSYALDPDTYAKFTYSTTTQINTVTNSGTVTFKDGNYNAKMKFKVEDSAVTITDLCIDDGKSLMYSSKIDNGSNIKSLISKTYSGNGCKDYAFSE